MIPLARAAYCPDCDGVFELAGMTTPCCGQLTWIPLTRWLGHTADGLTTGPSPTEELSRFDFILKHAPKPADAFRRFFADLGLLLAREHRIARRRLVTDGKLYAQ